MEPNHGGAETVVRGAEEPVLGEDQGPLSVPLLQPKPEEAVPRSGFFKTEIVWTNAIGFLVLHIVSAYAAYMYIYEVSWMTKLYAVVCYWLAAQGILLGAHRYYSHRAFKATEPLRLFMMFCNTLTGQNCMWVWVRDHRVHHKYSDTDADPHDASRGLFFSHMGWLMMRKLPEVIKRTREVDVTDLTADPLVMFQKKYYYPLYAACNLALMLVPMYAWNETAWNAFMITWVLRTTVMYNVTWSVNSFAHYLGNKPYDTSIRPVQLPWLSVFAFGEGWHNYHHAFPSDYKASEFGMPFNSTTGLIDFFAKIGCAYDLKEVSDNTVITKMQKKGDGSRKFVSRAG